jgi:hypothetical protein
VIPLAAPFEVFDHIVRLRSMRGVAVLGDETELEVLARRDGQERPTLPPTTRSSSAGLMERRHPEVWTTSNSAQRANHFAGAGGRGSFGRPRIISPMMLRWICEDPA